MVRGPSLLGGGCAALAGFGFWFWENFLCFIKGERSSINCLCFGITIPMCLFSVFPLH